MRQKCLSHQFVKFIPEQLEEGVLYISKEYGTAAHKCCCGCGKEVVTPLKPTDWSLRMEGDSVSLHPSIGNWNFTCQSHYLIKKNRVIWVGQMSKKQIENGRTKNRAAKKMYFEAINREKDLQPNLPPVPESAPKSDSEQPLSIWKTIKGWLSSWFRNSA